MKPLYNNIIDNLWVKEWFRFIKDNLDKPWDFQELSQNLNLIFFLKFDF